MEFKLSDNWDLATSNPCCLSYHPFPNYSVAIHKQAPKIISRIRNLLNSSVNDKTQKNQRSPPIPIDFLQRASVQNILHNILQYSAQYSARNIQRASAHNILHPVSSFPRLQSAHFLVAAINNDSCICFTTLSNRRGCGRVRKKPQTKLYASLFVGRKKNTHLSVYFNY